ncbi:MAG: hypothetical protein E7374_02395 [Clostridiales bacterium]|nr:hypothetical protein [Clostridiales bacterium]
MKKEIDSVLFLGIGGVSMHQLALAFKSLGANVLGYDIKNNVYTKICENEGIFVSKKFVKEMLEVDLVVKTGAIKDDDKLVIKLKQKEIPIVDRAVVLGQLASRFNCVIAVSGTHGKSTTSALIYEMLRQDGKKVSCHIGADVTSPRFNLKDDFLVVEACEFNKSFLSLYPDVAVVMNVEKDHIECYKSMFSLRSAFKTFLKRAKSRFVFRENSTEFLNNVNKINLVDIDYSLSSKLKGEYNLKNISMAVKVARSLDVKEETIERVLKTFKGIGRRYEKIGEVGETKVFIDYAHHPTEIKSFVEAFRKEEENSLIVFQPHTYSRTKNLMREFLDLFKDMKNVILYKEYPAREIPQDGISSKQLFLTIKENNKDIAYVEKVNSIEKLIKNFSAVAFVGAGDINLVAEKIIKRNSKK